MPAAAEDEPDESEQPFYSAYGKISSRFGADANDEPTVEDLTAADFREGGKVPKMAPSESTTLTLYVERCTAKRPTETLKGRSEKYDECQAALDAAFREHFADWNPSAIEIVSNPKPAQSPYVFLPPNQAFAYKGRVNSLDAPLFIHDLGPSTRQQLLDGTLVIDASDFPPQLLKYPRVGAFEVTYQLYDGYRPIAQKLVFSKLATNTWPSPAQLVKRIALHVQMDLYRQSRSHAKLATDLRAKAAKCAQELASALSMMQEQQQRAEVTAAELSAAADAKIGGEASALATLQVRTTAERQKALAARFAYDTVRVRHADLLAKAEVAEARVAMQTAKKELVEWEASQKSLEDALQRVEAFAIAGDSSLASEFRQHAHVLRRNADRELAEARAAQESATKELLEAMHADMRAAEAKEALCSSAVAAATEAGADVIEIERKRAAVLKAQEGVVEARVRIEDAEAQAAMAAADIEFKEAVSVMLQAKLARNEAAYAPSGDAEAAAAHAAELKQRALEELQDARQHLNRAANEAIEAAEARHAKEMSEAQQAKWDLTAAEAALTGGTLGGAKKTARLVADMERLRQIVEHESSQAEVSKLNLQITRRELSEKQAAIEEVVEKALAEEAQEAAERRKRELAAAAVKERDEADAAIAQAARLDAMAEEAEKAAVAATLRAGELIRQHGRHNSLSSSALASERQAKDVAFQLRRDATQAAAAAERERLEAESAEISKEEMEAELAYEHYRLVNVKLDVQRNNVISLLEQMEEVAATGELELELRVAETAAAAQVVLDKLAEQSEEALRQARKELEDVAVIRERFEQQQLSCSEKQLSKLSNLAEDAETAAEAASAHLLEVMSAVVVKTAALKEAQENVRAAEARTSGARAALASARARLDCERDEFGMAAVKRLEAAREMTGVLAEQVVVQVATLEMQLEAARRKEEIAKQLDNQLAVRSAMAAIMQLSTRLATAVANKAEVDALVIAAADAVEAGIRKQMRNEAMAASTIASVAEAMAARAEAEAKAAVALHANVVKDATAKGYASSDAKRQVEQAKQLERAAIAKAARKRDQARDARSEAEAAEKLACGKIEERVQSLTVERARPRKEHR